MAATNINIRTDNDLKAKAQSVLADLGLDMSTAINLFLHQIVYRQAIPFEIAKGTADSADLFSDSQGLTNYSPCGIYNLLNIGREDSNVTETRATRPFELRFNDRLRTGQSLQKLACVLLARKVEPDIP